MGVCWFVGGPNDTYRDGSRLLPCERQSVTKEERTGNALLSVQFKVVPVRLEMLVCALPCLRNFPNLAFETVPVFVRFTMALSRPLKEKHRVKPVSSRRSMV